MIKKLKDLKDSWEEASEGSVLLVNPRWKVEVERGSIKNSSESLAEYYFDIDSDINIAIDELIGYYDRLESISIVFG